MEAYKRIDIKYSNSECLSEMLNGVDEREENWVKANIYVALEVAAIFVGLLGLFWPHLADAKCDCGFLSYRREFLFHSRVLPFKLI